MKRFNAYGVKIDSLNITLHHWRSATTGATTYRLLLRLNQDTDPSVVLCGTQAVKPSMLDVLPMAVRAGKLPKPEGNLSALAYLKKLGVKVDLVDRPAKNRKDVDANC